MRQINTFRLGLFAAVFLFVTTGAMAQGLTMSGGGPGAGRGPFEVVEIHGAPDFRVSSDKAWSRIRASSTLPDSAHLDIAMAESVVLKSARGETYVLQGVYDFPLSRLGMRGAILRRGLGAYRLSTPVATAGVRGADRNDPGIAALEEEAVYRRPRDLWNALTVAVRRGDADLFPTFFTDETLTDSSFGEYIRTVQAVLPYPDSIDFKVQRLHGYPAAFLSKEEIIGDFAEWFRAVNTEENGDNFRYEIVADAVDPLRDRVRKYRGDLATFDYLHRVFIELQIGKFENNHRRMPAGIADLIAEDSSIADMTFPLSGRLASLRYDYDSKQYILSYSGNEGNSEFLIPPWTRLKHRIRNELATLGRVIRDYQESNGRLPERLAELLTLPESQRRPSPPSPTDIEEIVIWGFSFSLTLAFVDPWGDSYVYERHGDTYSITAATPDGDTFLRSGPGWWLKPRRLGELGFTSLDTGGRLCVRLDDNSNPVFIAGDFNNWSATATPMQYDAEKNFWTAVMEFSKTTYHQYKYVQNGKWFVDPENKFVNVDGAGNSNSVIPPW